MIKTETRERLKRSESVIDSDYKLGTNRNYELSDKTNRTIGDKPNHTIRNVDGNRARDSLSHDIPHMIDEGAISEYSSSFSSNNNYYDNENAYDVIKDLRMGRNLSYKVCFEEFLGCFGYKFTCRDDTEAKVYFIALIYRYYTEGEDASNRTLIALGLMQGFTLENKIGVRRKKYSRIIEENPDAIRKSEDKLFRAIIDNLRNDIQSYENTKIFIEELKNIAWDKGIVRKEGNRNILVLPSLANEEAKIAM